MNHLRQPRVVAILAFGLLASGAELWSRSQSRPLAPSEATPVLEVAALPVEAEVREVSPRQRLAWTQDAPSADELAKYRYLAYVDDSQSHLANVSCVSVSDSGAFECSVPMPPMSSGIHAVEIVTFTEQEERLASSRSPPLQVRMVAESAAVGSVPRATAVTTDGVQLSAREVATGLVDATAIAALPDGRLLIAERDGRIRVVRDNALVEEPATILTDVTTGDGRGLLAIVAGHDFAATGVVYVAFTADAGLRLSRLVLDGDTVVSRATLLDALPADPIRPRASLSIGLDFKLYLALDEGGRDGSLMDRGAYGGKVLRLNTDGTTPADQANGPVFATGLNHPAGAGWDSQGAVLWLTGTDAGGVDRLDAVAKDGTPVAGATVTRFTLPADTGASGVAVFDHPSIPLFQRNVFVAAEGARALLRVRPAEGDATQKAEWLLGNLNSPIRLVVTGVDGAIYLGTSSSIFRVTSLPTDGR